MSWQGTKELITDIMALVDGLKNPELREKVNKLRESILEVKEENTTLREENSELKRQLSDQTEMQYRAPHYWTRKTNGTDDGPFCSKCFDNQKTKIRVHEKNVTGLWSCPLCKGITRDARYRPPSRTVDATSGSGSRHGWIK